MFDFGRGGGCHSHFGGVVVLQLRILFSRDADEKTAVLMNGAVCCLNKVVNIH